MINPNFFFCTWKVPSRKPNLTTIQTRRMPSPDLVKSTKLPSPCKTCGRPDLPERFHSHPATPLKLSPRKNQPVKETKVPGKKCYNFWKKLTKNQSISRLKFQIFVQLKHPVWSIILYIEVFQCCDLGISRSPSNISIRTNQLVSETVIIRNSSLPIKYLKLHGLNLVKSTVIWRIYYIIVVLKSFPKLITLYLMTGNREYCPRF